MHYFALLILTIGFMGFGDLLLLLMCCNIVEKQHLNDSDIYWYATERVNKLGGPYVIRMYCWQKILPRILTILLFGFYLMMAYP